MELMELFFIEPIEPIELLLLLIVTISSCARYQSVTNPCYSSVTHANILRSPGLVAQNKILKLKTARRALPKT
jgi:hypothetical protein